MLRHELKKTIVIGAGGHSHSVCDILQKQNDIDLVGIIDGYVNEAFWGIELLGGDDALQDVFDSGRAEYAIVAIGSNAARERYHALLKKIGYKPVNAISPLAYISPHATIGEGVCVMPNACINANAVVGNGCIINTRCSVDHDTVVGDFVHVAPGSTLCGGVHIGNKTFVGAGSTVINGMTVGSNVMVGAGAAVVTDIRDDCTVVGVPARIIKEHGPQ